MGWVAQGLCRVKCLVAASLLSEVASIDLRQNTLGIQDAEVSIFKSKDSKEVCTGRSGWPVPDFLRKGCFRRVDSLWLWAPETTR